MVLSHGMVYFLKIKKNFNKSTKTIFCGFNLNPLNPELFQKVMTHTLSYFHTAHAYCHRSAHKPPLKTNFFSHSSFKN